MELIEAIRTLPLEQRVMIGAVWFERLSVADIADQFDVSEQYVKAPLHYGLRSLKSALDGDPRAHACVCAPRAYWCC
jgi:DNA-directed RNA polymerase specialized sigma24 family protein